MNKPKILNILKTICLIITLTLFAITILLILILKSPINSMKIIFYIGCVFLILSTIFYIIQLKIDKKAKTTSINKEKQNKDQKKQIREVKIDNIKIKDTKIEEDMETKTPINKDTKTRKLKILYYIFISLSILNLIIGLILLNIPLLYLLIIPNIISLFILSIVFYIISQKINSIINNTKTNRE